MSRPRMYVHVTQTTHHTPHIHIKKLNFCNVLQLNDSDTCMNTYIHIAGVLKPAFRCTQQRVPGCQSSQQYQPIRTSQIIFQVKSLKSGGHVRPTSYKPSNGLQTRVGGFQQNLQNEQLRPLTDDKRHQLQSNRANDIPLNAGFRLKPLLLRSSGQHGATWPPERKLVQTGPREAPATVQHGTLYSKCYVHYNGTTTNNGKGEKEQGAGLDQKMWNRGRVLSTHKQPCRSAKCALQR